MHLTQSRPNVHLFFLEKCRVNPPNLAIDDVSGDTASLRQTLTKLRSQSSATMTDDKLLILSKSLNHSIFLNKNPIACHQEKRSGILMNSLEEGSK